MANSIKNRMRLYAANLLLLFSLMATGGALAARDAPWTKERAWTWYDAQQILADALNVPVGCQATASEGGAWGIAVLAAYRAAVLGGETRSLEDWLDATVFADAAGCVLEPDPKGVAGFASFVDVDF